MVKEIFEYPELQKYIIRVVRHKKITKSGLVTNEVVSNHYIETKSLKTALKKAIRLEDKARLEKDVKVAEAELYKMV